MARILVFVSICVEKLTLDDVVRALCQFPSVEELYEVTGKFNLVALVSAADVEDFGDFLKHKILKISGVRSTVTSIVFNAPKSPKHLTQAQVDHAIATR